jgi:hypothetical protein
VAWVFNGGPENMGVQGFEEGMQFWKSDSAYVVYFAAEIRYGLGKDGAVAAIFTMVCEKLYICAFSRSRKNSISKFRDGFDRSESNHVLARIHRSNDFVHVSVKTQGNLDFLEWRVFKLFGKFFEHEKTLALFFEDEHVTEMKKYRQS